MEDKYYNWDPAKNEILIASRGISFEEIVYHILVGDEVETFPNPNQERYPGQYISVVIVEGYIYLVPYVMTGNEVFLKTIIPSRKATRRYFGGK